MLLFQPKLLVERLSRVSSFSGRGSKISRMRNDVNLKKEKLKGVTSKSKRVESKKAPNIHDTLEEWMDVV